MRIVKVSKNSKSQELAELIARYLNEDRGVIIEAVEPGAIRHMLHATTSLGHLSMTKDVTIVFASEAEKESEEQTEQSVLRLILLVSMQPDRLQGRAQAPVTDEEIERMFEDWQVLPDEYSALLEKIRLYHAESPILSGGDLDAAWDQAADAGEEAVGGSVATPDQDVVEELGEAVGLVYDDDEPLRTAEILEERDHHRWELDPESEDEQLP